MGQILATTGITAKTMNASVVRDDGQWWNTNSTLWEAFNSAHWSQYMIGLTEFTGTGIYFASYPSQIAANTVSTEMIWLQNAGSPTLPNQNNGDQFMGAGQTQGVNIVANTDKSGYSLASGQIVIKKNTGLSAFEFLMTSVTDHVTPSAGLTVTVQRSIDGAAFGSAANAAAEVGSGIYKIDLAAADLNGNVITLKFSATGADTRFMTIFTQA